MRRRRTGHDKRLSRFRRLIIPDALQRLDLALFRRTAAWHAPALDRILPRLSRAANKSGLWSAIAVALWFSSGRSGRRAGLRGMFGLVLTSFVGNLQALVVRRQRPDIVDIPAVRRLARLPTSPSFPSRHAASAFAFATGVTLEKPVMGAALYPLASAVAISRVYVGVHYPTDVVAGALLGVGLAAATRRFWPVAPDEPARARPARVPLDDRPDPDGTGLVIVVNPDAGSTNGGPTPDDLRTALPGAELIETDDDVSIQDALAEAAERARAIGIFGGDGSVNAAARAAYSAGKPLLVIPGGTLNHFARDIGMETVDDAVEAVRSGEAVGVDVGVIADHPFMNTSSFGSYVDLVDARERLEKRIGKWPAVFLALVRVLRRAEPVDVEIDGRKVGAWMAFIGNCHYHPSGFAPSWRDRLDDEILDIRLVDARKPLARLRVLWAALTGTLGRSAVYETDLRRGPIKVRSLNGPIRLATDGETFSAPENFTIGKAEKRLAVLVAPPGDEREAQLTADAGTDLR